MSTYASFQGRVFLGKRDTDGLPIEVRSPGNVAELKLSLKTDVLEHYESQTGQRSLDHRMVKQKSATVNLTIEEFTKENLALALYGNHVVGTPGTADPDFGALQFLDTTGFTAPFKASYAYGVATEIGIFTQALPERFLRLEGINTAQGNAKVLVELYRVAFDPLKEEFAVLATRSGDAQTFRVLGPLLDEKLLMHECIEKLYRKAKSKVRALLRCRRFSSTGDMLSLFKAHV